MLHLTGVEEDEVQVRVSDDQPEDAKITREGDSLTLTLRTGLVSSRAFVALGLCLGPLVAESEKYLQNTG